MSASPGIITRTKFISAKSPKYRKAIDYIDRSEATRKQTVDQWHAFVTDPALQLRDGGERISTLFTSRQDYVDLETKYQIKQHFLEAQSNESPMWQTVFSFDNDYLKELGLLHEKGNYTLNEAAVRHATRQAIQQMIDQMGLGESVEWAGAIHYNTGNIHVHTMLVVRRPENVLPKMNFYGREVYRGKIPPKTRRAMKSTFANTIENREPTLVRISYLMREELTKSLFRQGYSKDILLLRRLTELINHLPKDRRTWRYNHSALKPYQSMIDGITEQLLRQERPEAYEELQKLLTEQTRFYIRVYGEHSPEGNEGKRYAENKRAELSTMMGNALLKDLSHLVSVQEWKQTRTFTPEKIERFHKERAKQQLTQKSVYALKQSVKESYQDFLNRCSYERDEYQAEYKRKREQQRGRSY
ncbi:MobP2 family relaxase [Enterococcus innesii]|uniref:MobP2 family relaxase n=1 Tax=Enterococcus innesii TaxID=2839759 RepID=UPI0034A5D422